MRRSAVRIRLSPPQKNYPKLRVIFLNPNSPQPYYWSYRFYTSYISQPALIWYNINVDAQTKNQTKNRRLGIVFYSLTLVLLAVYGYFLFYHLGTRAFIDWDESIYAQVAKEAMLNHHYLSFTFWGHWWFEKPPLMIWVTILGYKLFGINELGARFFVPVFGLATTVLTLLLVKKIAKSSLAVFFTAASFGICYHFFFHSYFLEFDIPVTFFVLLALYGFILAMESPKFFYLFFTAIGLGVLTKSVIGLLPIPIALIYLLASRQWLKLKTKHFFWSLGLAALIILPWHIWESLKFGRAFWNNYLFYHVIDRYLQPLENNGGPFTYYFDVLWQNGVFLILLIASGLYFIYQTFQKNWLYFLLLLSFIFIFIFFSAAQTKGDGYIVVMYPYVLAMFGITLTDLLNKSPSKALAAVSIAVLVLLFLALGWQEENFKVLKLEHEPLSFYYEGNRDIARFIQANYPGKPVYGATSVEANLAFDFYMNKAVPELPANISLPKDFSHNAKYRVFHELNRSVYNFPDYLYIAP